MQLGPLGTLGQSNDCHEFFQIVQRLTELWFLLNKKKYNLHYYEDVLRKLWTEAEIRVPFIYLRFNIFGHLGRLAYISISAAAHTLWIKSVFYIFSARQTSVKRQSVYAQCFPWCFGSNLHGIHWRREYRNNTSCSKLVISSTETRTNWLISKCAKLKSRTYR